MQNLPYGGGADITAVGLCETVNRFIFLGGKMKIIITKKEKEFFEHLLKTAEEGEICPVIEKKIGKTNNPCKRCVLDDTPEPLDCADFASYLLENAEVEE